MIDAVRDQATFRNLRTQGIRGRSGPIRAIFLPHDRPDVLVAFAIGRKFGSAVERNRARRRVQAALRSPGLSLAPGAYLFSMQRETLTMPFESLLADVQNCVDRCASRLAVSH
ncbi:MAG: ribonuclease P protein component [Acidimicrobiales bacterium]